MNTASVTTAPAVMEFGVPRQGDIDSSDWDLLFSAVVARLRQVLITPPDVGSLQCSAEDCLLELEHLQTLLAQERGRAARLEREGTAAKLALEATGVESNSSRAGERRAQHQATPDALSSLTNPHLFDETLAKALASYGARLPPLALFFVDLDGFKPINERHGHAVGDELLRIVAARLSGAVRSTDLVCRMAGDEFACLVAAPPTRGRLSRMAHALFTAVSAPAKVGGLDLSVRPSIGIARCPSDGDSAATLLRHADAAMFRAKRRQLGHAFFDRRSDT